MNCLTEACSTPTSPGALVFAVMSSSLQTRPRKGKEKISRDEKRLLYRTDCLFHHSAFLSVPGEYSRRIRRWLGNFFSTEVGINCE